MRSSKKSVSAFQLQPTFHTIILFYETISRKYTDIHRYTQIYMIFKNQFFHRNTATQTRQEHYRRDRHSVNVSFGNYDSVPVPQSRSCRPSPTSEGRLILNEFSPRSFQNFKPCLKHDVQPHIEQLVQFHEKRRQIFRQILNQIQPHCFHAFDSGFLL